MKNKIPKATSVRIDPARTVEAQSLIEQYQAENPPEPDVSEDVFLDYKRSLAGLWGALLLAAVHVYVYMVADTLFLRSGLAASAGRILGGDWYRAATALLLHADVVHLLSNMAGIAILVYEDFAKQVAAIHELYQRNVEVFEDREKAVAWLRNMLVEESNG